MKKYLVVIALTCKILALLLAMLSMAIFLIFQSFAIPLIALAAGLATLTMGSIVSTWV